MQGLFDFLKTPEGQGLLSGVVGYAANARRGTPINNLGRGGLAGLAGYTGALDRQAQEAERAQTQEVRQMQLEQARMAAERAKAERQWRAGLPQVIAQGQDQFSNTEPTVIPGNPQAVRDYLMRPESPFADKLLEQQLFPKAADYKVVGNALLQVGPTGVKPVYEAPQEAPKPPAAVQEYEYAKSQGFQGSFTDFEIAKRRASASNVNVTTRQEGAESKAVGEFFGKAYSEIQDSGFRAQSKINQYQRLGQLLEGVNTGKLTQTGLEISKAAAAIGLNIDPNMGNKEAAQALSGEIALALRNPSGGAGMPGAMSDADRQFLVNMVPGLATTPEGRKLMLDTAQKLAQRDKDVARIAREYRKKNGSIDEGFYDQLGAFSEKNPLFGQQPKPAAGAAAGGWSIRPKGN